MSLPANQVSFRSISPGSSAVYDLSIRASIKGARVCFQSSNPTLSSYWLLFSAQRPQNFAFQIEVHNTGQMECEAVKSLSAGMYLLSLPLQISMPGISCGTRSELAPIQFE